MNGRFAVGAALAGAFALGALVIAYSSGNEKQDDAKAPPKRITTSFSDTEEDEIRRIVHDYLMTNPEVIIEAVNEYSSRERERRQALAKEVATQKLSALLDPKTGFVAGRAPEKAKVALIELYDYHCSHCKHAAPMVKNIIDKDADVEVVFRELPILREESDYAAEVSLAARDQGKFLDLHFALMDASGVLTKDRILSYAESAGLDVAQLEKARRKREVSESIRQNHEIFSEMGADGTPTFIIASLDGSYVDVMQGFGPDALIEKIDAAKRAANK